MNWDAFAWTFAVGAVNDRPRGVLAQSSQDVLGDGLAIAIAGLVIVYLALILISLFIASMPWILALVNHVWPETIDGHREDGHPESQIADDPDVLAAIGFVLHTEFQRQLLTEPSPASKN